MLFHRSSLDLERVDNSYELYASDQLPCYIYDNVTFLYRCMKLDLAKRFLYIRPDNVTNLYKIESKIWSPLPCLYTDAAPSTPGALQ